MAFFSIQFLEKEKFQELQVNDGGGRCKKPGCVSVSKLQGSLLMEAKNQVA